MSQTLQIVVLNVLSTSGQGRLMPIVISLSSPCLLSSSLLDKLCFSQPYTAKHYFQPLYDHVIYKLATNSDHHTLSNWNVSLLLHNKEPVTSIDGPYSTKFRGTASFQLCYSRPILIWSFAKKFNYWIQNAYASFKLLAAYASFKLLAAYTYGLLILPITRINEHSFMMKHSSTYKHKNTYPWRLKTDLLCGSGNSK